MRFSCADLAMKGFANGAAFGCNSGRRNRLPQVSSSGPAQTERDRQIATSASKAGPGEGSRAPDTNRNSALKAARQVLPGIIGSVSQCRLNGAFSDRS